MLKKKKITWKSTIWQTNMHKPQPVTVHHNSGRSFSRVKTSDKNWCFPSAAQRCIITVHVTVFIKRYDNIEMHEGPSSACLNWDLAPTAVWADVNLWTCGGNGLQSLTAVQLRRDGGNRGPSTLRCRRPVTFMSKGRQSLKSAFLKLPTDCSPYQRST